MKAIRLTAERTSERPNIVVDQKMSVQRVGPLEGFVADETSVKPDLVEKFNARLRIVGAAQRIHARVGGQLVFLGRL